MIEPVRAGAIERQCVRKRNVNRQCVNLSLALALSLARALRLSRFLSCASLSRFFVLSVFHGETHDRHTVNVD